MSENSIDKKDEDSIKKRIDNNKEIKIFSNSKKKDKNDLFIIDFNYYKNLLKKIVRYICIFSIFLLIYSLYFLSLEKCTLGLEPCCAKFKWIEEKITEEIISCLLMEIMIQLMIFKILSKKHLIHIIIIFNIFLFYSHGLNFEDHGYFNFLYYFILLFIISFLFIPVNCFIIGCSNKIISVKLIIIYFLIIIFIYIFLRTIGTNCNDWAKGLNNTYIENDNSKYGCQIQIPKICIYKSLEYYQDYSKLIGKNCKHYKNGRKQKENILKISKSVYINDTTKRIGYPLLNKDGMTFLDFPDTRNSLKQYFLKNLVDMDNKIILNQFFKNKFPEVEVNFTNIKEPKININLHFNKSLSQERKLLEENSEPYSDNILLIYLDSLSRVNALRQLKKTTKFFEKFMPYKGGFHDKYPSEIFHSFQFFKYHSFRGHTAINYPFLFYGQNRKNKNKSIITKFFKENGYITSEAIDWCGIDNIRTFHNFTVEDMYDHLLSLCDPNNDHFNSNTIRCLYGKHNTEYLVEFTYQFWTKYRQNRKYSIIIDNHAHEGTLTVVKYLDDIISNFLNNLLKKNLLKNSTVLLLSDHGSGMPSIYYSTEFYSIEENLPILLIIINDRKNISFEEQYKNIYENQQTFITPFDIYNSLGNIIYGNKYINLENITEYKSSFKSQYGTSLFDKIDPKERYPMKFQNLGKNGMSKISCK